MTDIIIVIERKRYDKEHWIKPAPKTGNTEQQYRVWFEGEEIGSWRVPECSAARWLLDHGKATRDDTLRTLRRFQSGDFPSMTGRLGWFADRTVTESDSQGGTPRFVKWRPMPEGAKGLRGEG
jgi:hypothetical protein